MRGKVRYVLAGSVYLRITPAYAGKSTPVQDRSCKHEDHPRLCGEKLNSQNWLFMSQGSPPPMRGKAYETNALAKSI